MPGTVRQLDLEFLEHHLLAHRIGSVSRGPAAALGGLDHLGSNLFPLSSASRRRPGRPARLAGSARAWRTCSCAVSCG